MKFSRFMIHATTIVALSCISALASAEETENIQVAKVMEDYLAFVDYSGGTISSEQIPKEDWQRFYLIDARDKMQFDKEHIPGAVNLEWRQVLEKRASIPKDKPVLIYCNTGSLSAQAGFALRVLGFENVRIIQGGFAEWKNKGGFDGVEKNAQTKKDVR